MKKETYVAPESEEIKVRFEANIMSENTEDPYLHPGEN